MTRSTGTPRPFVGLSNQPLPFIPVSIRVNAENTGGAFEIYEVGFSGREGSRALVVASPAGLAGFFEELGAGLAAGHANTDLRATLARKYDAPPAAR